MHPPDHRRDLPATRHDYPQPIDDDAYMEQVWQALRAEQANLPVAGAAHQAVTLSAADVRVVGYREHAGVLLPIFEPRTLHTQPVPRDLSPQPLLDPLAQRLLGAGIGGGALSAGVGWGIGQAANGLTGLGSGALVWIALMFLAAKLPSPRRRGGSDSSAGTTVNIRRAVFKKSHFQG